MIQLQVLNRILSERDKTFFSSNNLNEDYFSDYREEYRFIDEHIRTYGQVPDRETFLSRFKDFDIVDVHESESYLITALIDDYNKRLMSESFRKISPLVMAGRMDDALRIYKETAERISKGVAFRSVDILRDTSRFDAYVEKTKKHTEYFFSSGFPELDSITGGFDRKEEIVVVVARPGVGKSWISLKMAVQAAKDGLRVGLYSGEMTELKVGVRADTLIGHMNNGGINHGNEMFMDEYREYIDRLPTMFEGSIEVLTPSMIDGVANVNTLRMFVEKNNLDVLVIDQLSLLEESRGKTVWDKLGFIMRDLKAFQSTKKIPIIAVSQQNREKNDNGELDLTQIAGSDEIGRYATTVLFVEKKNDIMKLHVVKSRDNPGEKVLSYNVDLNRGNFTYIPEGSEVVDASMAKAYEPEGSDDGDYF